MNLADILRSLVRRWYITAPGLVAAAAVALLAWTQVQPTYERTSTQLLLPSKSSVPAGDNPYLYIGGLSQAADVIVRAVGSEQVIGGLQRQYPGTQVDVSRDPTTSGPVILIDVTAPTDAAAKGALAKAITATTSQLEHIQVTENVPQNERITVTTVTVDDQSTLGQKKRLVETGGAAALIVLLTLVVATFIDGRNRRARSRRSGAPDGGRPLRDGQLSSLPSLSDLPALDPDEATPHPAAVAARRYHRGSTLQSSVSTVIAAEAHERTEAGAPSAR